MVSDVDKVKERVLGPAACILQNVVALLSFLHHIFSNKITLPQAVHVAPHCMKTLLFPGGTGRDICVDRCSRLFAGLVQLLTLVTCNEFH